MSLLKRTGWLKRSPLRKRGPTSYAWEKFRNDKLMKDRNEDELMLCQDYLMGMPRCGVSTPNPDLHHIEGRDGKLLFDESKMVWLIRACHQKAHNKHNETHNLDEYSFPEKWETDIH